MDCSPIFTQKIFVSTDFPFLVEFCSLILNYYYYFLRMGKAIAYLSMQGTITRTNMSSSTFFEIAGSMYEIFFSLVAADKEVKWVGVLEQNKILFFSTAGNEGNEQENP